jgi:hypothetical protein
LDHPTVSLSFFSNGLEPTCKHIHHSSDAKTIANKSYFYFQFFFLATPFLPFILFISFKDMRVIPTLFALALATPALSIPVPRALFARSGPDVGHETSADPSATDAPAPSATDAHAPAPAVNNLVATQTTAALGADPTENERIINDLLTFAHVRSETM